MTSQTQKQIAIFPDLPRDDFMVDEHGMITAHWKLYFDQMTTALQVNFKPEGIVVPPKDASDIALLGNTNASIGNIIYDSTNQAFKGIILVSLGPPIVTITKTFTLT